MATTIGQIKEWVQNGNNTPGCTHVFIVCDTFDHEDYPVLIHEGDDVQKKIEQYHNQNMQRIMEIYNLSMDIEEQLNEQRSWNV